MISIKTTFFLLLLPFISLPLTQAFDFKPVQPRIADPDPRQIEINRFNPKNSLLACEIRSHQCKFPVPYTPYVYGNRFHNEPQFLLNSCQNSGLPKNSNKYLPPLKEGDSSTYHVTCYKEIGTDLSDCPKKVLGLGPKKIANVSSSKS